MAAPITNARSISDIRDRDSFAGLKVAVVGAGRSGVAAARVLGAIGAHATVMDDVEPQSIGADRRAAIFALGSELVSTSEAVLSSFDLVVTSPGIPRSAPILRNALDRGLPIWSEIELAYRVAEAPIVGITGTNGKTTTAMLVAVMLRASCVDATVCGNVSADEVKKTLVEAAFESRADSRSVLVAEISSFQLEWVERFVPRVAILTNVTPDHLNRHATFDEYMAAKARIFAAQTTMEYAVLNLDDPVVREIGERICAQKVWFSARQIPPLGCAAAWIDGGDLMVRLAPHGPSSVIALDSEFPQSLPGLHSRENVLAAATANLIMGGSADASRLAVRGFAGVPHRMEIVGEIAGVLYVNNSMCTNVAAAVSSLESLDRPAIVIAGGADKNLDFAPLGPVLDRRARQAILIGVAADKMERALRQTGFSRIDRADTLDSAVHAAAAAARHGDCVILSPACASFGMFADFEARGAAFRRAVRNLEETDR